MQAFSITALGSASERTFPKKRHEHHFLKLLYNSFYTQKKTLLPYKGLAGDSIHRDAAEKRVPFSAGTQPWGNSADNQGDTVWYTYGEQVLILSEDEMLYTRASKAQL